MTEVRLHHRPIPVWWWTRQRRYFLFVMRELSSFFVAWFVVYLLLLLHAISQSDAAYQDFLDEADSPWVITVNVVGLVFLALHTITWFHLTPKAMVLKVRGRKVPAWMVIASQYVGFAVVSALVYVVVTW